MFSTSWVFVISSYQIPFNVSFSYWLGWFYKYIPTPIFMIFQTSRMSRTLKLQNQVIFFTDENSRITWFSNTLMSRMTRMTVKGFFGTIRLQLGMPTSYNISEPSCFLVVRRIFHLSLFFLIESILHNTWINKTKPFSKKMKFRQLPKVLSIHSSNLLQNLWNKYLHNSPGNYVLRKTWEFYIGKQTMTTMEFLLSNYLV